jgi:phosphatidylinositol alpha-1,6-mannosyltransferase
MNILLLAKDYPPTIGGVENYSYYVAEGLSKLHNVSVLTFRGKNKENTWEDNVKVHRINAYVFGEKFKGLFFLFALLFKLLINSYDVVFATTWKVGYPAALLKRFFKFKLILACHGAEVTRHKANIQLMKKMKLVLSESEKIICVSHFTKNKVLEYSNVSEDKVFVVPNGLDLTKMRIHSRQESRDKLSLKTDLVYALTVSRIDRRKGHELVINAVSEIIKTKPNFRYLIVGNGPYKNKLEKQVEKLDLSEYVIFKGYVESEFMDYYYSAVDMFIMVNTMEDDTDFEGFGLVFAEAGYYSLPLIGGDNAGPKEVILHNNSGILVNSDAESIKYAIQRFLDKPELGVQMGKAARQNTCKEFNVNKMIDKINDIFCL